MNEAEIEKWEAQLNLQQKTEVELVLAVQQLEKLAQMWAMVSVEERQLLARSIFNRIIYDLDEQKIVDFQLKPWVEKFLDLYADLMTEKGVQSDNSTAWTTDDPGGLRHHITSYIFWSFCTIHPPRNLRSIARCQQKPTATASSTKDFKPGKAHWH